MRSLVGKMAIVAAALFAAALTQGTAAAATDYSAADHWLCRPDAPGACAQDIAATALARDGSITRLDTVAKPDAPIDCFYVYPTVSREPSANADLTAGPWEQVVVRNQFARFRGTCRLFAPFYRQVTLAGLHHTAPDRPDPERAHADIVDAWHHYLAHDSGGRGVVLIGHSQGAAILARLIAEEIDGKPGAAHFVGALLLGTHLDVPAGRDVGGSFSTVPLCRKRGQTGCVIAYSTFRATEPPGPRAPFVGDARSGMADACVNPMALDDTKSADAYLPVLGAKSGRSSLDTPFFTVPGLLTARCLSEHGQSWLAITIADDRRADAVGRLFDWAGGRFPGWGLHVLDPDLFMGNLVDLVAAQGKTWTAQHGR